MGFPTGSISVRDASYEDVTSGRNWVMPHAIDVQFLKVRGVIVIGNVPLPYKFILVKYDLSIDGTPWVLFSNLNDALIREFGNSKKASFAPWTSIEKTAGVLSKLHGWMALLHTMLTFLTQTSGCPYLNLVVQPAEKWGPSSIMMITWGSTAMGQQSTRREEIRFPAPTHCPGTSPAPGHTHFLGQWQQPPVAV